MSNIEPFRGSPFTAVGMQGTGDVIVALALDDVMHRMAEVYQRFTEAHLDPQGTAVFISAPVLLGDADNDTYTIELGALRVDRIVNLTPWSAKLASTDEAGYALGEAKRARPRLFNRTA